MRFTPLIILLVSLGMVGCDSDTTAPTTGKIISVSGDLAFGNVKVGTTAQRTFTISNSGNQALTFNGVTATGGTGTTGYTASPVSGTVQPGSSVTVTVSFTPPSTGLFSTLANITSDATSGNASISVSGTGI